MSVARAQPRLDSMEPYTAVVARWVDAEAREDVDILDALLDGDFRGDGPGGFVLTKEQWLDRYRTGDLVHDAFAWHQTGATVHDHAAVVMGIQTQTSRYRGRDFSGR